MRISRIQSATVAVLVSAFSTVQSQAQGPISAGINIARAGLPAWGVSPLNTPTMLPTYNEGGMPASSEGWPPNGVSWFNAATIPELFDSRFTDQNGDPLPWTWDDPYTVGILKALAYHEHTHVQCCHSAVESGCDEIGARSHGHAKACEEAGKLAEKIAGGGTPEEIAAWCAELDGICSVIEADEQFLSEEDPAFVGDCYNGGVPPGSTDYCDPPSPTCQASIPPPAGGGYPEGLFTHCAHCD